MSSKIYVLDGAIVECNQGFTPAKLLVTQNQKVKIQGKFKATDADVLVPQTFGKCKLKPTNSGYLPCVPGLQKWTKTSAKTTLGGSKKWLYQDSECMCATGGKVTITDPTQINSAGSAKEEYKEIAKMIPGAMLGNDKAPKVVKTYWMDQSGKNPISDAYIGEKAAIHVLTQNIDAGETVLVKVEDKRENEENAIYKGKVLANGTAQLQLVTLEKDTASKQNNSSTKAIANSASASATAAATASSNSKRELIEKGVVRKGKTINENGKIIIVNRKNQRGYDWIYGDNPSTELLKKNGMSNFDIARVKLHNLRPQSTLLSDMKGVLWLFSDVEDGFGKNGIDLVNHFHTAQGQPFTFGNDSNPVKEIKDSSAFKDEFLPNLKKELKDRFKSKNYINSNTNKVYDFTSNLPYYPVQGGLNPNVNEITTYVGGIQGCIANYEVYKENNQIDIVIKNLTFLDTFGAGWEDGGAHGMLKQWVPGLLSMFCLQHYKNVKDKTKYQPFAIILNIEL